MKPITILCLALAAGVALGAIMAPSPQTVPYKETPSGIVLTNVEATRADATLPNGLPMHYSRAYVKKPTEVQVIVRLGEEQQVLFSGLLTVEEGKIGLVEVRTILRDNLDAEHLPKPPAEEAP